MGLTSIQWAHYTFNGWWGCEKVSAACRDCYAETWAKRTGHAVWGADAPRRFFGEKHWNEPVLWNRAAAEAGERRRVFCASMADVFEDRRDLDIARGRLWSLIWSTPHLDWMLLSKRWGLVDIEEMVAGSWRAQWPSNAWAGATVEDRASAVIRLPALGAVPAKTRFLSVEPMLEDVSAIDLTGIHLVIIGGESGRRPRPLDLEATDRLIARCRAYDTAVFVKQMGEAWARAHGAADNHGGDPAEWEERFRVREMPEPRWGTSP